MKKNLTQKLLYTVIRAVLTALLLQLLCMMAAQAYHMVLPAYLPFLYAAMACAVSAAGFMKPRHRLLFRAVLSILLAAVALGWPAETVDGLHYAANGWIECYNDYFSASLPGFVQHRPGLGPPASVLICGASVLLFGWSALCSGRTGGITVLFIAVILAEMLVGTAPSDPLLLMGGLCLLLLMFFQNGLRPEVTGRSVLWLAGLSAAACILTVCVWPLIGRGREAMNGAASYVVERLNSWNRSMVDQGLVLIDGSGVSYGGRPRMQYGRLDTAEHSQDWNSGRDDYVMMQLTVWEAPPPSMYIVGFQADRYEKGRWEQTVEDADLENERLADFMRVIEQPMNASEERMRIEMTDPEDPQYRPYAGWPDDGWIYYPRFYEIMQDKDLWNLIEMSGDTGLHNPGRPDYLQIPSALDTDILRGYVGVPVRGESVWDAAVRVRAALHAHTSYDLHAGKPDEGEDPVSFFLEDSHRGFCMHYAAAGTLMLRYLGYESRYAEGYLVTEDAFQKNADGSYTAGVTVNTAHAWTEIYFDGIGWIPFEMTPGYGEAASADEPETEEPDMPASESTEENTEENTAVETETPSETKPQGESLADQTQGAEAVSPESEDTLDGTDADAVNPEEPAVKMLKAFLWVPAAIAVTAVLFWMQYRIRTRRLKHILSSASPEDRIKKSEARIEKLEKCSGIEVKIPERRLLYELWQEAAFSCHNMTPEDADKAFQYAGACGKFVETRQSKCGRLITKYIRLL